MSIFPEMIEGDPQALPDVRSLTYSPSEEAGAAFRAGFSELKEHSLADDPLRPKGAANYPLSTIYPNTRPITRLEREEKLKGRQGLDIPEGTSMDVADAMVQRYDDDEYYQRVYEHPGSLAGKIAALGGSTAAGLLDVKSDLAGFGTAKIATAAFKPLAKQLMDKMLVKDIFGSKAAQVATAIAAKTGEHAFQGATGFAGYQTGVEAQEQEERKLLNQPSTYIQSLQNIGHATEYGALFGGVLSALDIGLRGVRVPRGSIETPTEKSPEGGSPPSSGEEGQYVRVGGLLNSEAFKGVSEKAKAVIGKFYLPWSKDSDITMKEEAAGQMLNGQPPNLDVIMRQGEIDEGENFRGILRQQGIDPVQLSGELENASSTINTQLREISRLRSELKQSDRTLTEDNGRSIKENKEMSQAGLLKRFEQAQFEPSFLENVPETIPDNLQKHIQNQLRINELKTKLRESKDELPNKQTVRRIKELEKKQPKILTPKGELKDIKKKLLSSEGSPADLENTNAYKRLVDLSKVWTAARNLLDRVHLERAHDAQIKDLMTQSIIVDSIRNHVDDSRPPVSRNEMKAYSDHLRSVGIPESNYILPKAREVSLDERISQFDTEQVKELLDKPELAELKKELEEGEKRIKNQPKYADMVKKMVTCIFKGIE